MQHIRVFVFCFLFFVGVVVLLNASRNFELKFLPHLHRDYSSFVSFASISVSSLHFDVPVARQVLESRKKRLKH